MTGVSVSGDDQGSRSTKPFSEWLTPLLGLLASAVAVLAVFVKITPIEIDTAAGYVAAGLFVISASCAGVAAWSHRYGRQDRRRTVLFAVLAAAALVGGVLLAIGTAGATSNAPAAAGSPSSSTPAPTATSPTTAAQGAPGPAGSRPGHSGSRPGSSGDDPTSKPTGGDGYGIPSITAGTTPNPPQPDDGPAPSDDDIRYQGEFRLSAAQESLDLDLYPPQAYGPENELAVDDHAIWTVPPHTTGVTVSGSPTRAQCVDAVDRANPPSESFDNPRPGDMYCVRTSGDRYVLVRVVSAAAKDFTLALTVWN